MKKESKIKKYILIVLIILLLILIDQVIKILSLNNEGQKVFIQGALAFNTVIPEMTNNRGMLIVTDVVILIVIINFLATQLQRMDKKTKTVIAMILAGGFSNLIDKIIWGNVINYVEFTPIPGISFNLSHIYIFVGMFIFMGITIWNLVKRNHIKIEEESNL